MEAKKSPKADLEKNRVIYIQIGLVIILSVVLLAFEWKSFDKRELNLGAIEAEAVIEEVVLNTQQEQKPPPPQQQQSFELKIVEDDIEIEDDFEIDAEADQTTEIEEYIAPEITEDEVEEAEIFLVVEEQPTFPGGEAARIKFLYDNINYPQIARESGIEGTVYINFVVEPNGSISNIVVRRGIGGGCDLEAVRVVKLMPKWKAGKQRGKPVRVSFNMPIKFTLQ
ncbi:energy transducer TonB [Bacteroidota bacterium]